MRADTRTDRSQRLTLTGAMAVFFALAFTGAASGATRTVHVGPGGAIKFVDDASGTSVSNINVGDTITWLWEGAMNHSVTSGACVDNGGGGGYGYVTYGDGNSSCNATTVWPDPGLHGAGFTFSHTFTQAGTFKYFCDMHQGAMTGQVVVLAGASGPCDPSVLTNLCLNGGRFQVTADWASATASGQGTGVKLTDDSGYFWFFSDTNVELVVKVLNACPGAYWVFSSGLTNVGVTLTVMDTQNGAVYSYVSPNGPVYITQAATSAFPNSCP